MMRLKQKLPLSHLLAASLLLLVHSTTPTISSCIPPAGCVALANYNVSSNATVAGIASLFQIPPSSIQQYNRLQDVNNIGTNQALFIPFTCSCFIDRLGYITHYTVVDGDTVDNIVHVKFSNLSQTQWVLSASGVANPSSLSIGLSLSIPINCSCGNPDVSTAYGMFLTYVIQDGDTLAWLSQKFGIQADLLMKYNKNVDMNHLIAHQDIIFVPEKDSNGVYPPFNSSATGGATRSSAVIGASVGGAILFALLFTLLLYWIVARKRKKQQTHLPESALKTGKSLQVASYSSFPDSSERVIEFSYKQLAEITDGFSDSKIIGAGGFGVVYYAEINKKSVAVKKMDIAETRQFIAEVQVLVRVHHTNLVQLVGWCKENALFLVYEFVENGTLRSHLEGPQKGATPLTWASRLQIALDSARGLEYIHEYIVPSYIHRDFKPDNILLDKNLHAKVADFGLAKLAQITGTTINAGTHGYMPLETFSTGIITPKMDVYAFGVVLMQLVSAKGAIVIDCDHHTRKPLRSLFENFLEDPIAKEKLSNFVDPTLKDFVSKDNQTLDSVWKVIQLAFECTDLEPDKRPDMKTVVTRLSILLSPSEDWGFSTLNP